MSQGFEATLERMSMNSGSPLTPIWELYFLGKIEPYYLPKTVLGGIDLEPDKEYKVYYQENKGLWEIIWIGLSNN